ncbi:MAG: hypothetical protein QOE33_3098 [Acidobacteriota bacterium]|nr:hypothetical protein [Acidobacteriota bacterium]
MSPQSRAANKTSQKKVRVKRATTNTHDDAILARNRTNKKIDTRAAADTPLRARTRKPSVTIIGAGRLGSALAIALEQRGYMIDALVATTRAHARSSARLLRTRPLALAASELDQLPDSRIIIFATPDDRIAPTAARLAETFQQRTDDHATSDKVKRARVALHVSGALSSHELAPLAARGFATGSLHPLVSVSDPRSNAKDFAGAYFCVEGDAVATRAARSLVRALGGRAFTVAARDKVVYHASAVTASGHLVALFDLATDLLALCGLKRTAARRVLLPLARGTINNLSHARDNNEALTGPFARADSATVRRHLDMLATLDDPRDALEAYALLGLRSLRLARGRAADRSQIAEIARTLASFAKRKS